MSSTVIQTVLNACDSWQLERKIIPARRWDALVDSLASHTKTTWWVTEQSQMRSDSCQKIHRTGQKQSHKGLCKERERDNERERLARTTSQSGQEWRWVISGGRRTEKTQRRELIVWSSDASTVVRPRDSSAQRGNEELPVVLQL